MFAEMKAYLNSETCLSCEGCCRFDKEASDWRAKVGKSEESLILNSIPLKDKIESSLLIQEGGYLKDKLCHGMYACTFFNTENSTCAIYHNRPFECRLYPFVLTRWKGNPSICVHLPCPYVEKTKNSNEYNQYVIYLEKYIQENNVNQFLKDNDHLFGDYKGYEDELEWLFDIELG